MITHFKGYQFKRENSSVKLFGLSLKVSWGLIIVSSLTETISPPCFYFTLGTDGRSKSYKAESETAWACISLLGMGEKPRKDGNNVLKEMD